MALGNGDIKQRHWDQIFEQLDDREMFKRQQAFNFMELLENNIENKFEFI